jgi:hypothetical protein
MDTKFTKTQDTVLNGIVRHILTDVGLDKPFIHKNG